MITDIVSSANEGALITTGGVIIVALVSTFGLISVALINRTRIHTRAIRRQTENDHGENGSNKDDKQNKKIPNLRENIDINQDRLMEILESIRDTQRRQGNKLDRLFSITNQHTNKFFEIENTQTKEQK